MKFFESKKSVQECCSGCSFFLPTITPSDEAEELVDESEGSIVGGTTTSGMTFGAAASSSFSEAGTLDSAIGDSDILCLAEPILSRIADNDGTSLYPLIYPSLLGPLDMLSLAFVEVTGEVNGSDVDDAPSSALSFRLRFPIVGIPADDPAECDLIIALAGSLSRPDGEAVYGDAGVKSAFGLMATLSLSGVEVLSRSGELASMFVEEGDWVDKGEGWCKRSVIC